MIVYPAEYNPRKEAVFDALAPSRRVGAAVAAWSGFRFAIGLKRLTE